MSADELVTPLAKKITGLATVTGPAWSVQTVVGKDALRVRLLNLLGGDPLPATRRGCGR